MIDYSKFAIAKPESRQRSKARADRAERKERKDIRTYVFEREQGICRVCRIRRAQSMHELKSRGAGGKVSKRNSVAICGQLVGTEVCCHTFMQQNEIIYAAGVEGADGILQFQPRTEAAAELMRLQPFEWLTSGPTPQIRGEVDL